MLPVHASRGTGLTNTLRSFVHDLFPAAVLLAVFTVVCGVAYPLAVTGAAQVAFRSKADGSIVRTNGSAVGSSLIGQQFSSPQYFQSRPSAAGSGYDAMASSGSNLGPHNADLLATVAERVAAYRTFNGLDPTRPVPVDAVTASGSGLDPHISVANARLQADRVARTRGVDAALVSALINRARPTSLLSGIGEPAVNVLELNVALDRTFGRVAMPAATDQTVAPTTVPN